MSDYMSPGRRIWHYRMQRGMTQKTLGIAAGFSPETADIRIAQYESGARIRFARQASKGGGSAQT